MLYIIIWNIAGCDLLLSRAPSHTHQLCSSTKKGGHYLNYKEFLETIKNEVQKQAGNEIQVRISSIPRNNLKPQDTLILLDGSNSLAPAISLAPYYDEYLQGLSIESASAQILSFHFQNRKNNPVDFSFYADFEKIKNRIACKLIHYEKNAAFLCSVPHRRFLDLAVIYYYRFDSHLFDGNGSVIVQNTHLKLWNISESLLHETAVHNTFDRAPYKLIRIGRLLEEMTGINPDLSYPDDLPMYVLTNACQCCGASCILSGRILEEISERIGGDYYVLPSSVHECMIVPKNQSCHLSVRTLEEIVHEINEEYVAPEEVLSNSVYRYCCSQKQLGIAGCS